MFELGERHCEASCSPFGCPPRSVARYAFTLTSCKEIHLYGIQLQEITDSREENSESRLCTGKWSHESENESWWHAEMEVGVARLPLDTEFNERPIMEPVLETSRSKEQKRVRAKEHEHYWQNINSIRRPYQQKPKSYIGRNECQMPSTLKKQSKSPDRFKKPFKAFGARSQYLNLNPHSMENFHPIPKQTYPS